MNVVSARGLEVAYQRIGQGPPLVFVHGAGDDGRIWQPQLASLADEFTVVASRPQAFQLDGDYLGERQKVHFVSVPEALRVIC